MIVGVASETHPGEQRVALIPESIPKLTRAGLEVLIEAGAGEAAGFPDGAYQEQGASIASDRAELFERADLVLQVRGPGANPTGGEADIKLLRPGQVVIGLCEPLAVPESAARIAETGAVLLAMELMPRITRAQSMDVLSSMGSIAGYKAVLLAAEALPKMLPMMMTAAGTIRAARVFVIGAGVAGLQAIATARRLGALVDAYDVRPAVKEEVESLGGKFVELELETEQTEGEGGYAQAMDETFYRKQREMMAKVVSEHDIVITTAMVPGKQAPVLVTGEMVAGMRPGSVIVDLAAEKGGNCELSKPDKLVTSENGVRVLGPTNLPSTVALDASRMYARNVVSFLLEMVEEGQLKLDTGNQVIGDTLVTRDGQVIHPKVRQALGMEPLEAAPGGEDDTVPEESES